jgi:hypothetical protein
MAACTKAVQRRKDSQFQAALACLRRNYSRKDDLFSLGWGCAGSDLLISPIGLFHHNRRESASCKGVKDFTRETMLDA